MTTRRVLYTLLFLALCLSTTGALLACGPSFQAIYEGNSHFEHCYALEERPQTPLGEKADCWHDWSEHYTFGQTRDRIQYATARYVALSQSVPTDEAMMMAAPGMTPRTSIITAPSPTNAFAPPPKVLDPGDGATGQPSRPSERPVLIGFPRASVDAGEAGAAPTVPAAGPAPGDKPLPGADCVGTCASKFRTCAGAGNVCDTAYRTCVGTCVK